MSPVNSWEMIAAYSANLLLKTRHKCYQKRQSSSFLSVYVRCHSASAHCILSPLKSMQKKALMVTVALLWLTLCPKPLMHICIPICQIRSTVGSDVCVCVSVHMCLWECESHSAGSVILHSIAVHCFHYTLIYCIDPRLQQSQRFNVAAKNLLEETEVRVWL